MHPLRRYRKKRNLSQGVLAALMGVAPSTLCAYELWRRFPTLERALEIEALTGQKVKALNLINPKKKREIESIREAGS